MFVYQKVILILFRPPRVFLLGPSGQAGAPLGLATEGGSRWAAAFLQKAGTERKDLWILFGYYIHKKSTQTDIYIYTYINI